MGERFAPLFPLVLLVVLAGVTWWLDQALLGTPARREAILRHDPDYIVDKLTAVRMDVAGKVKYTLRAAKMTHYPDDDTTHLELPDLATASNRAPVTVTAKQGLVSSNGENVYFRDDVVLTRAAYADKSEMKLTSNYLHVIPEENVAKTDRPVTITDANTVVTAVGLEFNQETSVLKLHSQVRGTYHDAKRKLRTSPG
jgi:lipopolysaccharide export system protein LptC